MKMKELLIKEQLQVRLKFWRSHSFKVGLNVSRTRHTSRRRFFDVGQQGSRDHDEYHHGISTLQTRLLFESNFWSKYEGLRGELSSYEPRMQNIAFIKRILYVNISKVG